MQGPCGRREYDRATARKKTVIGEGRSEIQSPEAFWLILLTPPGGARDYETG